MNHGQVAGILWVSRDDQQVEGQIFLAKIKYTRNVVVATAVWTYA